MKQRSALTLVWMFAFSLTSLHAQVNEWTWMKGSSSPDVQGSYGVKGIPAPSNFPGGRSAGATCTDAQGNLWFFGGTGYAHSGMGQLSDLWKYNVSTNQWTWVSGDSSTDAPKYSGALGISSSLNNPGAREQCLFLADKMGNLWLFGGIKSTRVVSPSTMIYGNTISLPMNGHG